MKKEKTGPTTMDEYIDQFPPEVQALLQQVRATIQNAAPEAREAISYQMPAFKLEGDLVYFAAFPKHIGFYAIPSAHAAFKDELSAYKTGSGSVQFPLNKPLPFDLIEKMVRFRVRENLERAALAPKKG